MRKVLPKYCQLSLLPLLRSFAICTVRLLCRHSVALLISWRRVGDPVRTGSRRRCRGTWTGRASSHWTTPSTPRTSSAISRGGRPCPPSGCGALKRRRCGPAGRPTIHRQESWDPSRPAVTSHGIRHESRGPSRPAVTSSVRVTGSVTARRHESRDPSESRGPSRPAVTSHGIRHKSRYPSRVTESDSFKNRPPATALKLLACCCWSRPAPSAGRAPARPGWALFVASQSLLHLRQTGPRRVREPGPARAEPAHSAASGTPLAGRNASRARLADPAAGGCREGGRLPGRISRLFIQYCRLG